MDDAGGAHLIAAAEALLAGADLDDDALALKLAPLLSGRETEFLAWARHHLRWSLVVAELAERVCAKPREAAPALLLEILRDRRE